MRRLGQLAGAVTFLGTMVLIATAQDYPTFSGNPNRDGLPVDANAGAFAPNVYNNSGRNFLRWWDPVNTIALTLDNDETSVTGRNIVQGTWTDATPAPTVAFNYYQRVLGVPIYRYSGLSRSQNADDQTIGATAAYSFRFDGLNSANSYETYLNLPVGPTDVGNGTVDLRFPQKYWVVRISDVQGGPVTEVIDYDLNFGGFVRLGNSGQTTSRTFQPVANRITVTVYNTAPINGNGTFLDPRLTQDPSLLGRQLVYADGARLVTQARSGTANYRATPIVHKLQAPPIGGGAEPYLYRTVASRNEEAVIGDVNRKYNFGITTSYNYHGISIPSAFNLRLNKIWDWPIRRPYDNSDAEFNRFGLDKRNWVLAANKNRADQQIQLDDLNGGVTATANFLSSGGGPNNIGPTFLVATAISQDPTEEARFATNLPAGKYFVQVWLPGDGTLAKKVRVDIIQGGTTVDSLELDESLARGWTTIPFQPEGGYANTDAAPLQVAITNHTDDTPSVGARIIADAVRFVRQADLGVDSTPVQTTTTIQTGTGPANRDVTVVAMENGRLYCIDAHGDPTTGAPPTVYWTFPTEGGTDPNNDPAEDGKDRIAEMPYAFDLSSAFVANVGGQDLLYIAGRNGKVYCIEMAGRGDGTTRRRWTYPDDYDPSVPTLPMQPGLRPILGSVAFANAGGTPVVIVPTQEGRIYALDATGNAATKRTSIVWQYPAANAPTLDSIRMTPVVAFGKVFFCTQAAAGGTAGHVYALNVADGSLAWDQDGGATPFAKFDASSPVAVPASMLVRAPGLWDNANVDENQDRLFVCDSSGRFSSLDPVNGTVVWTTTEITTGAAGPLRFSFSRQYDNTPSPGTIVGPVPTVYVVDLGGRITGISATRQANVDGNYKVWGFKLDGTDQVATLATGGYLPATGNPHSFLYTGDSKGNLYAFNSTDDTNINPITPGFPPGFEDQGPNDPGADELNNLIDAGKFVLISPAAYDDIRERSDTGGGLTQADVALIAQNERVLRRHFDFGETMYVLVYDLPTVTGPNAGYYLDFEVSSAGRAPQHRQQPIRQYSDNANANYVILGMSLMTNGVGGVGPGPNFMTVRAVAPGNRGLQGTPVHLPKPPGFNPSPDCDYFVANPLGIAFLNDFGAVSSSVCLNPLNMDQRIITDPNDARWKLFNQNGNPATDQAPSGNPTEPIGPVGPDLRSKGQPVAHGSTGVQQLYVVDRSLMSLLLGRGMSGVRVGPRDIAWVKDATDPVTGGVYKPLLQNGVRYPGFEDYPVNFPNNSADYPDVPREALTATANLFGQAQNPLYISGVDLNAPVWQDVAFQTYRTAAGYDSQLARNTIPTIFEMGLNIPRYQPGRPFDPNLLGYYGSQLVFVDYQAGNPNFDPTQGSFRTFGVGLNVAVDERVVFKTPTIDVGSLPSGGGFNGGNAGGPFNPWDPATLMSPWNGNFNNLFQTFTIYNEGNANMLSLRTAKYFHDTNGNRPVELFMPGQHELAWLDASLHLHTSLDPRFSASRLVGVGSVGYDPQARNFLQKPRPRDLIGTRYNVNPRSRPNANLRTAGGNLFDPNVIVPGDPKMGVTAPIGAPAGQYLRRVFVFEDLDTANNVNADNPSLGVNEAFTDPGANLKFTVRESRVTNMPTTKSAPLVERVVTPNDKLAWSNTQPSAMRDGLGNLFVAWASNRVDAGNNPGWTPKARVEGDLLTQDKWRIYVGSLRSVLGNALGESPVNELNAWTPDTNQRWYRQVLVIDPPASLFGTANGETVDPASVKFGAPVFATGGFFNQMEFPGQNGRQWFTGRFLSFIGEATKYDAAGNATPVSMVFLVPLVFNGDGTITYDPGRIVVSPHEQTTTKSRPSMTLQRQGARDFATVYTTSNSNGSGQITWHTYPAQIGNFAFNSLRLGSAFENMGAPSVFLHRYRNTNQARAHVTFTAKVKGRRFSEVYMARLAANAVGFPQGRNPAQPYGTATLPLIDELTSDPATGIWWSPGLQWLSDQTSLDRIDIGTTPVWDPGQLRFVNTIWNLQTSTREFDATAGVMRFVSRLGGEVVIDVNTGAIRMNGVVLKRGQRLFVSYRPTIMRMTEGSGANYRSVAANYDDRFIGIRTNPTNQQRNLLGDLQYWLGSANPATPNDPLRWDRTILAYTRTSGDGTAATRPFFQTYRFGIQLPYGIAVDANGQPRISVAFDGGVPATEQFVQCDPATGRVFVLAGNEDRNLTVQYYPVDENGAVGNQTQPEVYPVRLISEIAEQAVPIENVGNESALSIALDPLNGAFNNINPETGRRPGLFWLFWTSSRGGQPDVFFETIAPRFSPRQAGQ